MGSKKSNNGDKKSKKKGHDSGGGLGSSSGSGMITDSRFASVHSDPRFQKVRRNKAKVEIDSRFDRIFTDRQFAGPSAPVDKRGKPRNKQEFDNPLTNYYRIEENGAEEKEKEEEEPESEEERKSDESEAESSAESDEFDLGEDEFDGLESDTASDEDESVAYCLDEDESEAPEENVQEIEKETHRLAVVNMDWRHVKATDLYVIMSSFLPKSGQIVSVAVYPSEFGLERMKEEELRGPVGIFDDEKEKSDDEEDELDDEKLRAYEKSKLRYYYAVVECDSVATADYLYKACDGVEFERSSNVFDLRFIPDSMEFKHPPRDVATEAPTKYEGLNFQTQALQHSKIHLSWDEDEPERARTLKRKLNTEQLETLELKEYLASDSESGDESDENEDKAEKRLKKRDMYRALLSSGDASDGDAEEKDDDDAQEMEVTFNTGLEDLSKRILEKKSRKQETVWEAHLRESRERKKLRRHKSKDSSDDESRNSDKEAVEEPGDFFVDEEPLPSLKKGKKSEGKSSKREKQEDTDRQAEATEAELELLLADGNAADTGVKGYNMKRKKFKGKDRKKVKETLEEDKVPPVVDDPRFSVVFTSPDFAMDPTDPQFKRSATYARQIALRKQKHEEFSERDNPVPAEPQAIVEERVKSDNRSSNKKKYELSTEIRSVKMRCQQIKVPSNPKASSSTRDDAAPESSKKKDKKIHDSDLTSILQSVKKHGLSSKKKKVKVSRH